MTITAINGAEEMMSIAEDKKGTIFIEELNSFLLITLTITIVIICVVVLIGLYRNIKSAE